MTSKMRRFAEQVLLEAPGDNVAAPANTFNVGGNFSSNFNTAANTDDLNLNSELNANSNATNGDDFNVDTSFDDFNYSSNFDSSPSFGGGNAPAGGDDEMGVTVPNAKQLIQTITDYFPEEGTVELTDEEGKVEIKPISQVTL